MEKRYGIAITADRAGLTLRELVEQHQLPPPQILFAEIQLEGRNQRVKVLTPKQAKELVGTHPILDVREPWERKLAGFPHSQALTGELMKEILTKWDRDQPILVFCHFGVRSSDAANYLAEQGMKNVCLLKGGIDAWSTEIDEKIPRYEGAWC